jgi:hypothetical protein
MGRSIYLPPPHFQSHFLSGNWKSFLPPHVSEEGKICLAYWEWVLQYTVYIVHLHSPYIYLHHTDKKENEICLVYKEIQMGAVAKSYMRKGILVRGNAQIFSHI